MSAFAVLYLEKIVRNFKDAFDFSVYNINDVPDLTPSRHSAIYITFNLIFKCGKNLSGFTSLATSKHQETLFVQISCSRSMPSYLHFFSRQYPF